MRRAKRLERKRISIENSLHQMQEFVIDEYEDHIVLRIFLSRNLEHVDIPSTFEGKKVTVIGDSCFDSCMNLKTLSFPNTLESIGFSAFADCKRLTELILPDSITEIDCFAFQDCRGLKKVVLPKKLKRLKSGVFCYCYLRDPEFILPDGLEVIEGTAFFSGGGFYLVIPDSVKEIGKRAFNCGPHDEIWFRDWPYGEEVICSGIQGKITGFHSLEEGCMLHDVALESGTKQFVYPCDYLDGKILFVDEKNFQSMQRQFTSHRERDDKFEIAYKVRKAWLRGLIAPQ